MFETVNSPYLVPFDGSFRHDEAFSSPPENTPEKSILKKQLKHSIKIIDDMQKRLYAQDHASVLLIFQAMDAAGKDGTIRAILSGINPAGCQVFCFKKPSSEELDHDFLWRTSQRFPERGRIGVFNRSYYEEVLVVRVHPQILNHQRLPRIPPLQDLWTERLESIVDNERHLARNGTTILKFWLNVSKNEQCRRLLRRAQDPSRHWKFSSKDVEEREHWDTYMRAYEQTLNATSRPWAPWYSVPADNKPFMRATIAEIVANTLTQMDPQFPSLPDNEVATLTKMERTLKNQLLTSSS